MTLVLKISGFFYGSKTVYFPANKIMSIDNLQNNRAH